MKSLVIDADAHIVEGEATWDYLKPSERRFRPFKINADRSLDGRPRAADIPCIYWITDMDLSPNSGGDTNLPVGVRDLTDIPTRLALMDELGIDIQVIYPSFFLIRPTEKPDWHLALARAYNRFMADAFAKSSDRLRWVIVPVVERMEETLAEMEFGKEHGACGVMLSGIEGRRALSDEHYYPLYEKASALNMPICSHVGIGNRSIYDSSLNFYNGRCPVLTAFHDLMLAGIPDRFPKLRFGFIEAGAQWVPYLISEITRRSNWVNRGNEKFKRGSTLLQDKRMFVSCRVDDDIPYLKDWCGKKSLVTGTDLGHDDYSRDIQAFSELRKYDDKEMIDGIVGNNARVLYGI